MPSATTVPSIQDQVKTTSINSLKNTFPESFDKVGNMLGEYNIVVDSNVPPIDHDWHRMLIMAKEKNEVELKEMTAQGNIDSQTELTPWVSSLTYPCKANGSIQICLNPKDLNKGVIREYNRAEHYNK